MDIEWRDIEGSFFQVSNTGLIKRKNSEKILKPGVDAGGYFIYPIVYEDGRRITKRIHRLIGGAFLPNPDNLPQIDHINQDRQDNNITNLRWVTKSQNQQNKTFPKNNKSGFRGVRMTDGRWRASIWANGKFYSLGCFKELEDAVKARAEAEQKYHN